MSSSEIAAYRNSAIQGRGSFIHEKCLFEIFELPQSIYCHECKNRSYIDKTNYNGTERYNVTDVVADRSATLAWLRCKNCGAPTYLPACDICGLAVLKPIEVPRLKRKYVIEQHPVYVAMGYYGNAHLMELGPGRFHETSHKACRKAYKRQLGGANANTTGSTSTSKVVLTILKVVLAILAAALIINVATMLS